jgi:putative phosphoesterase
MTKVGVISDTHINPGGKRVLAPVVYDIFRGVDFILHAGDLNTLQTVRDLEAIAPVFAVPGNNCDAEACAALPAQREMQIESCRLGLVHGDRGRGNDTAAIALGHVTDVDCVVFGHSHWPLIQWKQRAGGRPVLLFNPGSAGQKRNAEHYSCGLLHIDADVIEPQIVIWD